MRKFRSESLLLLLSGIILVMVSCAGGSCFEETESYLKASFYKNTTRTAPDTLSLSGLNVDSTIYLKALKVQPALIPLNASSLNSVFVLTVNGVSDTIRTIYTSYPHLISKECGYTYYHHLDTILPVSHFHLIKKIEYINRTITNLNVENIHILF
jgi:hypothetical protein